MQAREWLELALVFVIITGLLYVARWALPNLPSFLLAVPAVLAYGLIRQR